MKEIRYSPELWAKDRNGAVNDTQTEFAQRMAEKKGGYHVRCEGNTLLFMVYGARKVCGGYNETTYIFRPATWAIQKYDVRTNRTETKTYVY